MLNNPKVNVDALRNPMRGCIDLYFFWRDESGRRNFVQELTIKTLSDNEVPPDSPLSMNMDTSQQLIDALWSCGLRPTEGTGSAGALSATQNHLKDLQKITDKLFSMLDKKE